ncbi:MAG: tyrosine-protein phosphatase [Terriglobales bacterium]
MVDIHCHILPQVDDGPKSWEAAAEMCRIAAGDGITHIVATPHANDSFVYDRQAHVAALERLRELSWGVVGLSLGCDFHFSYDNVQDLLSHRQRYTIDDTGYLLVELSDFSIPAGLGATFQQLIGMGIRPVITHPERNPILQQHPEQLLDWVVGGTLVQVTASAVTGLWGRLPRRAALWLLEHEAVHVLASDAHDPKYRPPMLSAGRDEIARLRGSEVAESLVRHNPQAIVRGEELPYRPTPAHQR